MRKKYFSVEQIPVWQDSHKLVLDIYRISQNFPNHEIYGLTSQIRRAAYSIPSNISEGFYRHTTKELIQFIYNAKGSCGEIIYHLRLTKDLDYISEDDYKDLKYRYENIAKQISGWIKSLKSKITKNA